MTTKHAHQVLERVADAVVEIDRECQTLLNNVEYGLANVKLEFRDRAIRETGKKLTEEKLIAWLVQRKLSDAGLQVDWESPYPGSRRRKCDLVVRLCDAGRLWLELKLAWKAWFNCEARPTYANNCYLPYLQGKHHTHSFRHDFEKLGNAASLHDDYRAVCLIGFDWSKACMNKEVAAVVQAAREENGAWQLTTERHWPDRRCDDFRINVWSWSLCPQPAHFESGVSADRSHS